MPERRHRPAGEAPASPMEAEAGQLGKRRRFGSSGVLFRLVRAVARVLQLLVSLLEEAIEALGQEPDRRWEHIAHGRNSAFRLSGSSDLPA